MSRSVDSDDTSSSEFSDEINRLTERIFGAAIHVHRELGPGLLEKTYEACLAAELRHRELKVANSMEPVFGVAQSSDPPSPPATPGPPRQAVDVRESPTGTAAASCCPPRGEEDGRTTVR